MDTLSSNSSGSLVPTSVPTNARFSNFLSQQNQQRNVIFHADEETTLYLDHVATYPISQIFKDKNLEGHFLAKLFYSGNYRRFIISDLIILGLMIVFNIADIFSTEVQWRYFTILVLRVVCYPFFVISLICKCIPCIRRHVVFIECITTLAILVGNLCLNIITALRYQNYVASSLLGFPEGSTMAVICGSITYRYVFVLGAFS